MTRNAKSRTAITLVCCALASGCRTNEPAPASLAVDAAPPLSVATESSVALAASATGSVPAPAGSIPLAQPPDVRVVVPASSKGSTSLKGEVHVGQTFGILLPQPDDWMDAWEIESCAMEQPKCPLGEPLTIITREGGIGREVMWKIAPDKVGTHQLRARYMQRATRTDPGKPTRRMQVTVTVVPAS